MAFREARNILPALTLAPAAAYEMFKWCVNKRIARLFDRIGPDFCYVGSVFACGEHVFVTLTELTRSMTCTSCARVCREWWWPQVVDIGYNRAPRKRAREHRKMQIHRQSDACNSRPAGGPNFIGPHRFRASFVCARYLCTSLPQFPVFLRPDTVSGGAVSPSGNPAAVDPRSCTAWYMELVVVDKTNI